jgi:hypothetical protein
VIPAQSAQDKYQLCMINSPAAELKDEWIRFYAPYRQDLQDYLEILIPQFPDEIVKNPINPVDPVISSSHVPRHDMGDQA